MNKSTKLEAVNVMLNTIGEASTNTLTGTVPFEVSLAESILDEIIRETLLNEYNFNTEEDVTFSLDVNNKIPIATNVVRVIPDDLTKNVTIRSNFLYDLDNGTDVWTKAVEGAKVYLLDFDDLPEAVKRYAMIRAARVYADRLVGSKDIRAFSERDELEAKANLTNFEFGTDRLNMLADSYSTYRMLDRDPRPGNNLRSLY